MRGFFMALYKLLLKNNIDAFKLLILRTNHEL